MGAGEHTLYPRLVAAIATGCGLGELMGLKRADADVAGGSVKVSGSLQRSGRQWVAPDRLPADG